MGHAAQALAAAISPQELAAPPSGRSPDGASWLAVSPAAGASAGTAESARPLVVRADDPQLASGSESRRSRAAQRNVTDTRDQSSRLP